MKRLFGFLRPQGFKRNKLTFFAFTLFFLTFTTFALKSSVIASDGIENPYVHSDSIFYGHVTDRFHKVDYVRTGESVIVPTVMPLLDTSLVEAEFSAVMNLFSGNSIGDLFSHSEMIKKQADAYYENRQQRMIELLTAFVLMDTSGFFCDARLWSKISGMQPDGTVDDVEMDKSYAQDQLKLISASLKAVGAYLEMMSETAGGIDLEHKITLFGNVRKTNFWKSIENAEKFIEEGNLDEFKKAIEGLEIKWLDWEKGDINPLSKIFQLMEINEIELKIEFLDQDKIKKLITDMLDDYKKSGELYIKGHFEFELKMDTKKLFKKLSDVFGKPANVLGNSIGLGLAAYNYYSLLSQTHDTNLAAKRLGLDAIRTLTNGKYDAAIDDIDAKLTKMEEEKWSLMDNYLLNIGWDTTNWMTKVRQAKDTVDNVYTLMNLVGISSKGFEKFLLGWKAISNVTDDYFEYKSVQDFTVASLSLIYMIDESVRSTLDNQAKIRFMGKFLNNGLFIFAHKNLIRLYDPAGSAKGSYADLVDSQPDWLIWADRIIIPSLEGFADAGPYGSLTLVFSKTAVPLTRAYGSTCGILQSAIDFANFVITDYTTDDLGICSGPQWYGSTFFDPIHVETIQLYQEFFREKDKPLILKEGMDTQIQPMVIPVREYQETTLVASGNQFDHFAWEVVTDAGDTIKTAFGNKMTLPNYIKSACTVNVIGYTVNDVGTAGSVLIDVIPYDQAPGIVICAPDSCNYCKTCNTGDAGYGRSVDLKFVTLNPISSDPPEIRSIEWSAKECNSCVQGQWIQPFQQNCQYITPLHAAESHIQLMVDVIYENGIHVKDDFTLVLKQSLNPGLPDQAPVVSGSLTDDYQIALEWEDMGNEFDYMVQFKRFGSDEFITAARLNYWEEGFTSGFHTDVFNVLLNQLSTEVWNIAKILFDRSSIAETFSWLKTGELKFVFRVAPVSGEKVGKYSDPVTIDVLDLNDPVFHAGIKGPGDVTLNPKSRQANLIIEERPSFPVSNSLPPDPIDSARVQIRFLPGPDFMERNGESLPWPEDGLDIAARLCDGSYENGIPVSDWEIFENVQSQDVLTVEARVLEKISLISGEGKLGDYKLQLKADYPWMSENIEDEKIYSIFHNNLNSSVFATQPAPYLEVQTKDPLAAKFSWKTQTIELTPGRVIRIYPRNQQEFLDAIDGQTVRVRIERWEDGSTTGEHHYFDAIPLGDGGFEITLPDYLVQDYYRIGNLGVIGEDVTEYVDAKGRYIWVTGTTEMTEEGDSEFPDPPEECTGTPIACEVGLHVVSSIIHKLHSADQICVVGNYVYRAGKFFTITDVSHPAGPQDIGYINPEGEAYSISVIDNFAYLAGTSGLQIIDLTNRTEPTVIATVLNTGITAKGISIIDQYAYVVSENTDGDIGLLQIFDISIPQNPSLLSEYTIPELSGSYTKDISVKGNYAYIAAEYGLRIINVSNPNAPFEVGSLGVCADKIEVVNHYVYAIGCGSLQIIDVSNPHNPFKVTELSSPGLYAHPVDVAINENYAYIVYDNFPDYWAFQVVDVRDVDNLLVLETLDLPDDAESVAVSDGYAYVGFSNGFSIIDISASHNNAKVSGLDLQHDEYHNGIFVLNNYAYLSDGNSGLKIIDITNPSIPDTVYETSEKANDVAVHGDYAYVLGTTNFGTKLTILDISNPENPVNKSSLNLKISENITVNGRYAYVTSGMSLYIIDVSDPAMPYIKSCTSYYDYISSVAVSLIVSDGYAYLCSDAGIIVVDISDPGNPSYVTVFEESGGASDINVNNGYAYVTKGDYLKIYDIHNVSNPDLLSELRARESYSAKGFLQGNYVYIVNGVGLQIIDITDPGHPFEAAFVTTSGISTDVYAHGDYAYILHSSGFQIINAKTAVERQRLIDNYYFPKAFITFLSENLPDGSFLNEPEVKRWTFQNGSSAITGLKAVNVGTDLGLGISQNEIPIGNVAPDSQFNVELALSPTHTEPALKKSEWRFVDGSGNPVEINNSSTNTFWLEINTNRAPEFSELQFHSAGVAVGETLQVPVRAFDPDGDTLTFTMTGTGSISEGMYSGIFNEPGVHQVTLIASDGMEQAEAPLEIVVTGDRMGQLFKDVSPDINYYGPIHYIAMKGVVIGVPGEVPGERLFLPYTEITQSEALKMVIEAARVRGLLSIIEDYSILPNLVKETRQGTENYTWVAPYLFTAQAHGAIADVNTFDPSKKVTTEWLATLIDDVFQLEVPDVFTEGPGYIFPDEDAFSNAFAYASARKTAFYGYLGTFGENFVPQGILVRMVVAKVVASILCTPTMEAPILTGTDVIDIYAHTIPAVANDAVFQVTGIQGLASPGYHVDSANWIMPDDHPDNRVDAAFVLSHPSRIEGIERVSQLAAAPVTITPGPHSRSALIDRRDLLIVLQDTASGARNIFTQPFAVELKDRDGDFIPDNEDAFPDNREEWSDVDGDGIGDNSDPDIDDDGIDNITELLNGLDPRNPSDAEADFDEDGVSNKTEIEQGTDVNNPENYPGSNTAPSFVIGDPINEIIESVSPLLAIKDYDDLDNDTHQQTFWQISTDIDFANLILERQSGKDLDSFQVPASLLDASTDIVVQKYFWRAKVTDNRGAESAWSDGVFFIMPLNTWDQDENGVPDEQEQNLPSDLDQNGVPDENEAATFKKVNTLKPSVAAGLKAHENIEQIEKFEVIETEIEPPEANMLLPYGIFSFRLSLNTAGLAAKVKLVLTEPAPDGATIYKYDPLTGWFDFSDHAMFNETRTEVVITIEDGSKGDADGIVNGIIIDPVGIAVPKEDPEYLLIINKTGNGTGSVSSQPEGIDCGTDCSESYTQNTVVSFTATPNAGSKFTGWSEAFTGTDNPCTVTMNEAKTLTANFDIVPVRYELTVTTSGNGSGTVTSTPPGIDCRSVCMESFNENAVISLTAAPATGSEFTGWAGAFTGPDNPCSVTMASAKSITAQFDLKTQPVLSVTPATQPVGSGTGSTTFDVSNTGTGTLTWTAAVTSGNSWLSISNGSSGTNTGAITCFVDENTDESDRTGTIRITAANASNSPVDVTVVQAGQALVTLLGITIKGPDLVTENTKTKFNAVGKWSDGTFSSLRPIWLEDSDYTSMDANGVLTTSTIPHKQHVNITALYLTDAGTTKSAIYRVAIVKSLDMTNCAGPAGIIQRGCEGPQDSCDPFDFENADDYLAGDPENPNRSLYETRHCIESGIWDAINAGDIIDIRMDILVDDGTGKTYGDKGVYWAQAVNAFGIFGDQYFETESPCEENSSFPVYFGGGYDYLTADGEIGTPLSILDFSCDGLTTENRVVTIQSQPDQLTDHGYTVLDFDVWLGIDTAFWEIDIPEMRVDPAMISGGEDVWVSISFIRNNEYCCQDIYIGRLCDKNALSPELRVNPVEMSVDETIGTAKIHVANAGGGTMNWNAVVVSGGDWLSISTGGTGVNTGTISCDYSANPDATQRAAIIRITAPGTANSPIDVTLVQAGIPITMTGLHISGSKVVNRNSMTTYTAMATWSDGSTSIVTPYWEADSGAFIGTSGLLITDDVTVDTTITISAFYYPEEGVETATFPVLIEAVDVMMPCSEETLLIDRGCESALDDCDAFDFETPGHYLNNNQNLAVFNMCDCIMDGTPEDLDTDTIVEVKMEILVDPGTGKASGDNGVYWAEDVNENLGFGFGLFNSDESACSVINPYDSSVHGIFDYYTADGESGSPYSGIDFGCDSLSAINRVVEIFPQYGSIIIPGYIITPEDVLNGRCVWTIDIPEMRVDPNRIAGGDDVWVRVCFSPKTVEGINSWADQCCQDVYIGQLCGTTMSYEKGDINGNGMVDLPDAIYCLRVMSGLYPTGLEISADVDGDGKIGIADLIFILETVSGLR